MTIPVAHGEGCYYTDSDTLKSLEDNQQVGFRYSSSSGTVDNSNNPIC